MLERKGGKGNPPALLVRMYTDRVSIKNSMEIPFKTRKKKKTKHNYHMTQKSHYWAYILRKPQFKKTHVPNVHYNTIYNGQDMETT